MLKAQGFINTKHMGLGSAGMSLKLHRVLSERVRLDVAWDAAVTRVTGRGLGCCRHTAGSHLSLCPQQLTPALTWKWKMPA